MNQRLMLQQIQAQCGTTLDHSFGEYVMSIYSNGWTIIVSREYVALHNSDGRPISQAYPETLGDAIHLAAYYVRVTQLTASDLDND